MDIVTSDNLDTVISFLFNPSLEKDPSKLQLLNISFYRLKGNSFLGVMSTSVSVIFFNEQEVIEEFYVEKNERIVDFFIDDEDVNKKVKSTQITVQILMRKEISENSFSIFYQEYLFILGGANSGAELTNETEIKITNFITLNNWHLTKSYIVYMTSASLNFSPKNNTTNNFKEISLNNDYSYEMNKSLDSILIIFFDNKKPSIINLNNNSKQENELNIVLNKSSFLFANQDSNNNKLYYIVIRNTDQVDDSIKVLSVNADNNDIKSENFLINKACKISHFSTFSGKFLIVCNNEQLVLFKFGEKSPLWSINENISKPIFSKLLNIDRSEYADSTNEVEKKTISISSILNSANPNKEINNLAINVVNNIINTAKYIFKEISSLIKKTNTIILSKSVFSKQVTFLVVQKNNDLLIYDIVSDTLKLKM